MMRGEGGVQAGWGIKSFIPFPARFLCISFRCVIETGVQVINSRQLTQFLPRPVDCAAPKVLHIALALSQIEASDA